jgi:hypothetical protein
MAKQQTGTPIIKPQTKVIDNFTGRLTRIINGDMNSGFAKFSSSFGYDPFTKPMNLTWMEGLTDVFGITDLVLDGKVAFGIDGGANPNAYLIGSTGNLYKVQTVSSTNNSVHSVVGVASVRSGSPTYNKGASMEFFGQNIKIYVGSDSQINSINFDGSSDAVVGNASRYAANVFRPLADFIGTLVFGNGPTIAQIDSTGTVSSPVIQVSNSVGSIYSSLNPPLPTTMKVHDIDTSPDNNYMLMSASEADYETIANNVNTPNLVNTFPASSKIFYWNGTDGTATAGTTFANNLLTALQSYLQQNHMFASDSMGAGLYADSKKIITLQGNKSPFPNATGVNGQFLYWSTIEKVTVAGEVRTFGVMYYYGSLDQETPVGLYRMIRFIPPIFNGNMVEMPFNQLVNVAYTDVNSTNSSVRSASYGTHYMSYLGVANNATQSGSVLGVYRFNVPPSGSGTAFQGIFETQNQLFSKRIGISQIRVYCEPTTTNNAFQLDMIGGDGNVVTNGTFTYTYAAGSDVTSMQGPMERINFNPGTQTLYSLGVRITNTGSANMTIKKIEIDYMEEGK